MNWLIFILVTYVFVVLEVGLRTLLAIPGPGGASPSLLLVLAVFLGLLTPASTVAWSFLILGLLTDLLASPVHGGVVLGPATLGYLVGAYAIVQLRTLVFRESVLSLAVMTFVVGVFVHLVAVALFTLRGLPITPAEAVPGWDAAEQLVSRFLELVYSAGIAIPVGYLLFRYAGIWGFAHKPRTDRHF